MNKERVQMLIDALRSGKYEQLKVLLHTTNRDSKQCYCITGLMCEIYRQHNPHTTRWKPDAKSLVGVEYCFYYPGGKSSHNIPLEVINWFGMSVTSVLLLRLDNDTGQRNFQQFAEELELRCHTN